MDRVSDEAALRTHNLGRHSALAKSDEIEVAVCTIRESRGWIQRIVDDLKDANVQDPNCRSTAVSPINDSQELASQVCFVSRFTADSSDSIQLQTPLFTPSRCKSNEPLYPVVLEVQPHGTGAGAMDWRRPTKLLHVMVIGLVQVAIVAFVVALWLTLTEKASPLLVWHPVLMCVVLVVLTEAAVITQGMPWTLSLGARQKCRKAYRTAQWIAAAVSAASLLACMRGYGEA
ncbi:hypothetical protein IWW38_005231, partial [Coemansia aciculifera]